MLVEVRPTRSLQEIIKRRQHSEFIGREKLIESFRDNLTLSPDDERRRFIFNVYGESGVGKTWLLRRFSVVAQQCGMISAWADATTGGVVDAMEQIATRIEAQGRSMAVFSESLRAHRRLSEVSRIDSELSSTPPRLPCLSLLERSIAAVRAPIERSPLGFVDHSAISWRTWSTVQAGPGTGTEVPEPVQRDQEDGVADDQVRSLSATFVRSLRAIAQDVPVCLFFDGFEQSGRFLDDWLQAILDGRYGELPASTIIVVGGRERLAGRCWATFEPVIEWIPLERFTDEEARTFLTRRGVTDEGVSNELIRVSGRLPMLLATATLGRVDRLARIGPAARADAIDYLIHSLDEPTRRAIVLDAALPRRFDLDLLTYLADRPDASAIADWLRTLPFVEARAGGWGYRPGVRDSLVRRLQREMPERWSATHARLAAYHERLAADLLDGSPIAREATEEQDHALEALYHRLCESPGTFLPKALNGFIKSLDGHVAFACRWCQTIEQAGEDAGDEAVRDWGRRLIAGLDAFVHGRYTEIAELFEQMIPVLGSSLRSEPDALAWRGRLLSAAGRIEQALQAYAQLVEAFPGSARYLIEKGVLLARLGHYPRAIEDLGRALAIEPDHAMALANRGEVYRLMEAYDQALADFTRALKLDPSCPAVLAGRGRVYLALERFGDALADLEQAVTLAPDEAWILAERGSAYRGLRQYDEALADLNRALRLDPENVWALAVRGDVYWQMRRYDAARADFQRALDLQVQRA